MSRVRMLHVFPNLYLGLESQVDFADECHKWQEPLLEAVAGLTDELGDQPGCCVTLPLSVQVNHKVSS